MRYFALLSAMALFISIAGGAGPTACISSTSTIPYITVSQLEQRLLQPKWPEPPPGARLEGIAIFEIEVSAKGEVLCMNRLGGHPLLLSILEPVVQTWRFRAGGRVRGLIPVRYSSAGFQLL